MDHVLTLVAAAGARIDTAAIDAARSALSCDSGAPVWLQDGIACDLLLCDAGEAAPVLAALSGRQIDVAVQPAVGRRKRLLIADMESTVIEQEMLDELAAEVGLRERVADITARAMNGELDFRAALYERVALLEGLDAAVLARLAATVRIVPGAAPLVATMKQAGAFCALVSGGFRHFTGPVATQLGFHVEQGNALEVIDDRLTGRVLEPVQDRHSKLAALEAFAARLGVTVAEAIAVGDGANDLPMLQAAGLGVAFRAKPVVAAAARARVDHGDLSALLFFQGYPRDEWAGAD